MKTAYAYIRVSSKNQTKGDGFARQLAAIRKYAKAQGYRLVRIYREEVSGRRETEQRPALCELLQAKAAPVLIERLDRLARDLMTQEAVIRDLQRKGFQLISVAEPDLDSNEPSRILIRQILGAVAEYERSLLVAKLRAARERIKATGKQCEGRKPYGYYQGERAAVERMQAMRAEGLAYDAIAARLTNEGTPTRKGTAWAAATVRRVLLRTQRHRALQPAGGS